jgi:hypothetical protein
MAQGVPMAIRVRYNEPKFNQHSGNIVKGVSRDWRRRIHNVNTIPRPNLQQCTYYHHIRH